MVMIFLQACALTWLATSSATSARTGLHGRAGGWQRSYWPTKAWRSAPPASQGMNASSLAETASYLRTTNQKGWDKQIANGTSTMVLQCDIMLDALCLGGQMTVV